MITKQQLDEFEQDSQFIKLQELLKKPNIFNVLKLDRYEIRHSNFIAWLMDPNEKHGLNDTFLNLFLIDMSDLFESSKKTEIEQRGNFKWLKRESVENIDLFLEFDNLVIAIENKFYSDEHSDQLTKYREYVFKHFANKPSLFVYLTPDGRLTKANNEYVSYSYHQIAKHLQEILNDEKYKLCNRTKLYIEDYLHSIQSNIMKSNDENLLAAELYNKYAKVIQFINENANSDLKYIVNTLNLQLRKKMRSNYIKGSEDYRFSRFTTTTINKILQKYNKPNRIWKNGEPILFEFSLEKEESRIVFLVSISNFDKYIGDILDGLLTNEGIKTYMIGGGWRIYNNIPIYFEFDKFQDEGYIQEKFDELYTLAEPTIQLVEKLVTENKDKFTLAYEK